MSRGYNLLCVLLAVSASAMVPKEQAVQPIVGASDGGSGPALLHYDDTGLRGAGSGKTDPMMDLLHWATQHSDPERLKEVMQKYQDSNLTIKDVYGQDVFDALFVDEADVMRQAIHDVSDFRNTSLTDDDLMTAIDRLQEMVEQVDNAANLHVMGGLVPLLELASGEERGFEVRALALWTIGVAAQNNEPVQADIFSVNGLQRLVDVLPRDCKEITQPEATASVKCCEKLVFALSALVRNHAEAQAAADVLGLFDWLVDAGVRSATPGVSRKSLSLLETVLAQNGPKLNFLNNLTIGDAAAGRRAQLSQALLSLVQAAADKSFDSVAADAAEKSLLLLHRLVTLRPFIFDDPKFRNAMDASSKKALEACATLHSASDELCVGFASVAKQAVEVLAAQDIPEEEL